MSEFEYENEMTQPVIDHLWGEGYVCETELCCGAGRYADIMAVKFNQEQCQKRMKSGPISPLGAAQHCSKAILDGPEWWPHFDDVMAVELKLTDWKTAIRQARAYSREVVRSFACFPESTLESEKRLDEIYKGCLCAGHEVEVGLMGLSGEGTVSYLKRPTISEHVNVIRVCWQVEKLWMKWRERHEQ